MDDHISFLRTVCRLHDKGLSRKTVWQKLIKKWAFRSIQNDIDQGFEEIYPKWVLSVRKRILYQVRENSVRQKIISTSNNPLCGHLIVNKTALVWKNLEGALHIKQTNNWCLKLIEPRSLKFTQDFRNYETFPIYVEIADEIEANTLFDRSLPSTRCFLDISPERAPLKPVSQRIWTPLRRFGSPYQTFLLSIDFIIFDN